MDTDNFSPDSCDLCGSREATVLAQVRTGRSMRSDGADVTGDLLKLRCASCGLVRGGDARYGQNLIDMYTHDYAVAPAEYTFYTPQGPVTRSALFCEWLGTALGPHRWRRVRRCLEVGAGSGGLLQEFQKRFPEIAFEGIELCETQATLARQRGLNVRQGQLNGAAEPRYDVVYSVAVVEHVPSPTRFLKEIRRCLPPGGLLYLCQPTQDVPSYDVFFTDHVHHFGTEHVHQYARKCGFRELGFVVGHEWMPNFSLHLWEAVAPVEAFAWHGPPAPTACAATVAQVTADFRRLDETLARLGETQRRVAVFGLNEVYALARAYSDLGRFPIHCGLADRPDNPAHARLGFPVVEPEACPALGVTDVVLTVNKVYHARLLPRLNRLGVSVHPVLT